MFRVFYIVSIEPSLFTKKNCDEIFRPIFFSPIFKCRSINRIARQRLKWSDKLRNIQIFATMKAPVGNKSTSTINKPVIDMLDPFKGELFWSNLHKLTRTLKKQVIASYSSPTSKCRFSRIELYLRNSSLAGFVPILSSIFIFWSTALAMWYCYYE